MKTLERHILKEFIFFFSLSLAGLVALFIVIDLFENMDNLIKFKVPLGIGIWFFLYKVPYIIGQTSPVATLLASLISIGLLSRHNEITAMKAGGIRLFRIISPMLISGIAITIGVILLNEYITPYAIKRTDAMQAQWFGVQGRALGGTGLWIRTTDGILNIKEANLKKGELRGVTLFRISSPFTLKERLIAREALWEAGAWVATDAKAFRFNAGEAVVAEDIHAVKVQGIPGPQEFSGAEGMQKNMTLRELMAYIRNLRADGFDAGRYSIDFYSRFTFPAVNFIMVVIGVPFAITTGRKGGMATSIAISVAIAFSYWVVFAASRALGISGAMPPLMAAAFPDMLYLAIGALLFGYVRQ
jgi:lipopolysaccharide export system permease protein